MAFGDLKGTLTGSGTSITSAIMPASGSVAIAAQDLVIAMAAEAGANTVTGVTTGAYGLTLTPVNAGTLSTAAGRLFYGVAPSSGTLIQATGAATTSGNDWALVVAVIEGPFTATPLDRAPANTTDAVTPFTCAATTALSQANEVIVAGLSLARGQTATTATSPLLLAINTASSTANAANSISASIGRQVVTATTSVTPVFACVGGTINGAVQIVGTFRQGTAGIFGTLSISQAAHTVSAAGNSIVGGTLSINEGGDTLVAAGTVPSTGGGTGGLIAHTEYYSGTTVPATTSPIDTTGANLLIFDAVTYGGASSTITDNKGNTWTQIFGLTAFGAAGNYVFYVNSQTPNVGPGHTVTYSNLYGSGHFAAFSSSTTWSIDTYQTNFGNYPLSAITITPAQAGELFIAVGSNMPADGLLTSINVTVLGSASYIPGILVGGAYGYKVHSGTSTFDPAWTGYAAGEYGVIGLVAFIGNWTASAPADITGTLSLTQAAQTLASVGSVSISGTLSVIEAADTISAAGGVRVDGTLTVSEAADTISAAGSAGFPVITGTLTVIEAADTITATGTVLVGGTLGITEAADTISAAGVVGTAPAIGTVVVTEAPDTLSAAGTVWVSGTLGVTEAADTIVAAGGPIARGTLGVTEAADTIVAAGGPVVGGALSRVQANQTLVATAVSTVRGTLGVVEAADTINATGEVVAFDEVLGTLARTQDNNTLAATGEVVFFTAVSGPVSDGGQVVLVGEDVRSVVSSARSRVVWSGQDNRVVTSSAQPRLVMASPLRRAA